MVSHLWIYGFLALWGFGKTTNALDKGCDAPLGLQSGKVVDSQLSGSDYHRHFFLGPGKSADLPPWQARLNNSLAWCSSYTGEQPFLMVDFSGVVNISGIAMQGLEGVRQYYVTSYKIVYGTDGKQWHQFNQTDTNEEKVWSGNVDGRGIVKHVFPEIIQAQFIRINPLTYHTTMCLRLELYGCSDGTHVQRHITPNPGTVPSKIVSTPSSANTTEPIGMSQKHVPTPTMTTPTEQEAIPGDCKSPLGFEDGRIKDAQLSASSYYHFFYIKRQNVDMKPKFARLNGPLAWCCPPTQSQQCHLTVDLGRVANISGIATQGIDGVGHYYVKTYKIRFGTDGVHWEHLGKNDTEKGKEKVWLGNHDGSTIAQNTFPHVIQARFLQIYPLSHNLYSCLRMELYGCMSGHGCKPVCGGNSTEFPATPESNLTRGVSIPDKLKMEESPSPSGRAVVIGTAILSVIVFLLIVAVVGLYVWRGRHVRKHAMQSRQVPLTEVAVEPDCEDITAVHCHVGENFWFAEEQDVMEVPFLCKDEEECRF